MDYQEVVGTRNDIWRLYENVIARSDIKRYRGYTESGGDSFAWDPIRRDYIRENGIVWFDNPTYIDPDEKIDFSFDELMKGVS